MLFTRFIKSLSLTGFLVLSLLNPASAAELQNLRHQTPSSLLGLLPTATTAGKPQPSLQEQSRSVDFQQRLHLRLQQTYDGYPVWGAQVMMHLPKTQSSLSKQPWPALLYNSVHPEKVRSAVSMGVSMNGFIYQNLAADLQKTPAFVFSETRAQEALTRAVALTQQKSGQASSISGQKARLFVYVDSNQKAHWAYFIQFKQTNPQGLPQRPCYLMDAVTFKVYQTWNNVQTHRGLTESLAGGHGGNLKTGMIVYDDLPNDRPALPIRRDERHQFCYLENQDVVVRDARHKDLHQLDLPEQFVCSAQDPRHQSLFWNGSLDAVNGAYSPGNDALYIGKIIKAMYEDWYGLPPLVKENGGPMRLVMRVHEDMENAYWDGETMTFGDGGSMLYPLVSLGVAAHEISHGFTEQHAGLIYDGQSGGLNESFSDMAAQAAEYFAYGKNQWQIGPEILKEKNQALRYMDHPSLDCADRGPGEQCSIENVQEYQMGMNVHLSSGIFNRVFYLMGTAPGWNTKKAFDVMVQANRHYWLPLTNFAEAACGVMDAVRDYGYSEHAAKFAFKKVGLDINQC